MMTSTQPHDTTGSKDDSVMHLQVVLAARPGVETGRALR
jgi:hypothetical protein